MMATTQERIKALAGQMPELDAEAEQRARDARRIQMQAAVANAAPQTNVTRAAQTVAPQLATAAGQSTQEIAQRGAQQQVTLGEQALGAQAQESQTALANQATSQAEAQAGQEQDLAGNEAAAERVEKTRMTADETAQKLRLQREGIDYDNQLSFMSRKQREDLSRLGRDVKSELFDSRLQFDKDEAGRKFSNERQLWDYTVSSARSDEELKSKLQTIQLAASREAKLMDLAYQKTADKLNQDYLKAKQDGDQASMKRIADIKRELQKEQQRQAEKAANTGMIIGGLSTVAMVAGTAMGSPVGGAAAAGAVTLLGGAAQRKGMI